MKIKSQVYKTRNSAVGHDLGSGVERKAPPLEYPGPSTRAPGPGVPRRVLNPDNIVIPSVYSYSWMPSDLFRPNTIYYLFADICTVANKCGRFCSDRFMVLVFQVNNLLAGRVLSRHVLFYSLTKESLSKL